MSGKTKSHGSFTANPPQQSDLQPFCLGDLRAAIQGGHGVGRNGCPRAGKDDTHYLVTVVSIGASVAGVRIRVTHVYPVDAA